MSTFNKILLFLIGFILLIIITTTLLFLSGKTSRSSSTTGKATITETTPKPGIFSLTRLRTITNDNPPVSLVITANLSYPTDDTAFYEELDRKTLKIRSIITEYFTDQSFSTLQQKGEPSIKAELLTSINNELVLGNISTIYFTEYLFLE